MEIVREVRYDERRWRILAEKRAKARKLMEMLISCGFLNVIVHGSVARGDVDEDSDVDVVILDPASPSLLQLCLERYEFQPHSIKIVQPTPIHTPKLYIYLDPYEELIISTPLAKLRSVEIEFYRFSGMLSYIELLKNERVPGVNKKLMLIEPRPWGHVEIPVIGNEGYVARRLGVSMEVIRDRVDALTRRVREGHTGLFVEIEVPPHKTVEEVVRDLCKENKLFRQRLSEYIAC